MIAEPLCDDYNYYEGTFGYLAYQGYYWMIVILSKAINYLYLYLAPKCRFKSKARETLHMTVSIFFVNMVVYVFVPYVATADVRIPGTTILPILFSGMYHELNAEWFQDIGPLVCKTMFFSSFMPLIEVTGFWFLR